jgi:two-component system chemotaxis response regulator CheV
MNLLDKIEKQTGTGKNEGQLELLLFRLHGSNLYGINVYKIKEIIPTPKIAAVPKADPRIIGLLSFRDEMLSVVDMARALDMPPLYPCEESEMLYTEFSRQRLGFVIKEVEKIVYFSWQHIRLPPDILSHTPYITAITTYENQIVQIIDIERILADITGTDLVVEEVATPTKNLFKDLKVLGVDDSRVARAHLKNLFEKLGLDYKLVKDGREAMEALEQLMDKSTPTENQLLAVVSDVEMPEMDGYALLSNIRKHPKLHNIPVILNSSLSETVGQAQAKKHGATAFLTKWDANELIETLENLARKHKSA